MTNFFNAKSWPFMQAYKLKERLERTANDKGYVLFETGYGPSGLPHMGTFGEVLRTTLVRRAFQRIDSTPTRLFAFSDDLDGLRKVPENVPNREMLAQYLGYPLTSVPDPFGQYASFGDHNNARLKAFIEQYGFDYEFRSATEEYRSGRFDPTLLKVLQNYEAIMQVMLPTLGEERRKTYSPILPISPVTGKILMVPLESIDKEAGTVTYRDENGELHTNPVTGGHCKLQWKADWAMRWVAQGVDYEMAGRDLAPTFDLSTRIAHILGGKAPEHLIYELFVDEHEQKISKSKGNGLTIEEWMAYGIPESMAYFIYTKPTSTKKLHIGTIAASTREYFNSLATYPTQDQQQQIDNPVWAIHNGQPYPPINGLDYNLVINLASVMGIENPELLKAKIVKNRPEGTVDLEHPLLDVMIDRAVRYYVDQIKPTRVYRLPNQTESVALAEVRDELLKMPDGLVDEDYQTVLYTIGKKYFGKENLRTWFKGTYECLFGQTDGPRMGGFIGIYGRENTANLISNALHGKMLTNNKAAQKLSADVHRLEV